MKRGYVLIAVLWVVTVAAAATALAFAAIQRHVWTVRNTVSLERSEWLVQGCMATVRATLARDTTPWSGVGSTVATGTSDDCIVQLAPVGLRIDVNHADSTLLSRALLRVGIAPDVTDSLVAALLDWRDEDQTPRALGAERGWYQAQGVPAPRNGPLVADEELYFVRGWAAHALAHTPFSTEPGRILLSAASLTTLAALPGINDEVLAQFDRLRREGRGASGWNPIVSQLSPATQSTLGAAAPALAALATWEPDAWMLEVTRRDTTPPSTRIISRVVRGGLGMVVVQRKVLQ